MLELWICMERKANTERMLDTICAHAAKGIGGQILVVPEQFSHDAERRLCLRGGEQISRYAEVLSFSRLAARVFAVEGGTAESETDASGRLLMMALAVEQVRSRLKLYASSVSKPEFLLQLLDTLEEFRSFCITPAALREASNKLSGVLAVKTEEFALLMESFEAVCANSGQNPQSRLTRLLYALEDGDFACGKQFYFDSFTDFNGVELEIIGQLLAAGAKVRINLTCDDLREGQQVFETARETGRQLRELVRKNGTQLKIHTLPVLEANHPLQFLSARVFGGRNEPYAYQQSNVHLRTAADSVAECRAVAGEILRLVHSGVRWREITVACTELPAYQPILKSVFRRAEIPAYYAGNTDILGEPVVSMVLSALEAASNGMEQEDVLAYLKSGFSPVERERCDRLENYALLWNITGSRWERPWTMNPYGFRRSADEESERQLRLLNEDREVAIAPLSRLRRRLQSAKTTAEMVLSLNAFLESVAFSERLNAAATELYARGDLQRAQEYAQVYGILCTVMEQTYGVLGLTARSPEDFCHIFRTALSQCDIGTIPAKLDCVTVGSLMSQRQADTEYLFLLGANEGAFPAASEMRSLLTDSERASLMRMGLSVSATAVGRLDREMAGIHSVLAAPRQGIYISAITGREAYLFRRAAELFPAALQSAADAELVQRARREYLSYLVAVPSQIAALREREPALAEAAKRIVMSGSYSIGRLSEAAVHAVYGKKLRLSSSKIDALASCRFAYFLNYGLCAQERRSAEFDAPLYGTFVHDVLEHTTRQVQREGGFASVSLERTLDIAQERMEEYAERELVELCDSERSLYLFRRTFDEVRQVVSELYQELSISRFEPQWFELEFSKRGIMPAVHFAGEQCSGTVEGFVDRADVWRDGERCYVRVVDYKTGKKDFDYTNILHGIGMQMLLYLFALRRSGESLMHAPLIPSGVLYFPARIERVSVRDKFSEKEVETLRRKSLKRQGLLLDHESVLEAMEPYEQKPVYLPYTLDREGKRVGDLATPEQFQLLENHVFRMVAALGDALYSGVVTPNPYFRDMMQNACAFCPYGAICGSKAERRWLRKINKGDTQEFWRALEQMEVPHG